MTNVHYIMKNAKMDMELYGHTVYENGHLCAFMEMSSPILLCVVVDAGWGLGMGH